MPDVLKKSLLSSIFFIGCVFFAAEAMPREIPQLTGPVVDEAGKLSPEQNRALSQALANYYQQTKNQLQVLIVDSLQGEVLEDFSIKVAEKWKIGTKEGTGVILLVALAERKLRIEVGQGLEGALTDAQAGRIINDHISPNFRQGNFYEGIASGLVMISRALGPEIRFSDAGLSNKKIQKRAHRSKLGFFFIIFMLVMLARFLIRTGGRGGFGGGGWFIGGGGYGGGGFSSGGGGGWSGGGGGFSGGGASGGW